jgi:hypothetical protein
MLSLTETCEFVGESVKNQINLTYVMGIWLD